MPIFKKKSPRRQSKYQKLKLRYESDVQVSEKEFKITMTNMLNLIEKADNMQDR